jgi:hypothetical protein
MAIKVSKDSSGIIVITITGVFLYKDLETIQSAAKGMLNSSAKINCLILASKFGGWGKEGNWGDMTFMYAIDNFIGKIAVVGEESQRAELLMFLGAGYRKAMVKYFFPNDEDGARIWLSEPAAALPEIK